MNKSVNPRLSLGLWHSSHWAHIDSILPLVDMTYIGIYLEGAILPRAEVKAAQCYVGSISSDVMYIAMHPN